MAENTEPQEELTQEPSVQTDNLENEQAEAVAAEEVPEMSAEEQLKIELAELKDKYLRLYADFENFRRRTSKEKLELLSSANAELMKTVLPVVDDFERAMQSFELTTEVEPLKEGVLLIYNKFYKALESKGLKPMESKGEVFDAELHESITQFPAPSEDLKGKVVDEIEKGYFLNEKVIRYAKVVVGA
ncbi:nucleotide exchange factor GrpE [Arundinibacter roseus]|uniref:Protein GrpE n=1 Tax=Arundinibacter roseus TaxID=2070510 RepID=A0A4R4KII7_9BACT|nr:nucleotide exchange factor GrpE [Arundinibacter roseus]TDB67938.1 nucleotide exchange factor GrpE [Arundinibacter roseus]